MMARVAVSIFIVMVGVTMTSAWDAAPEVRVKSSTQTKLSNILASSGDRSTNLYGPQCTSKYAETIVPANTSVIVKPPLKRGRYKSNLNCGWWFYAEPDSTMVVECSFVHIHRTDNLVFYSRDQNKYIEISNKDVKNQVYTFESAEVAIVLETSKNKNAKGFRCTVSSNPPPPPLPLSTPPPPTCPPPPTTPLPTTPPPTTNLTTTSSPTTPPEDGCRCGVINRVTRIMNGTETEVNEYPWQIGLKFWNSGLFHTCGGSIISESYIVTSAHCLYGYSNLPWVSLGMHNQMDLSSYTPVRALAVTLHPAFNPITFENDIAIIEVPPITFTREVGPICLPDDLTENYVGEIGTVSGWGKSNPFSLFTFNLMKVEVPILANAVCETLYNPGEILDMMLCAGDLNDGGEDSCQGDSGGPLFVNDNGSAELVGVVSFGLGCGIAEYPGVYARVTSLMGFIVSVTGGADFCPRSGGAPTPPPVGKKLPSTQ